MANPLKFEIHIGEQLAKDIQKYTASLNSLIKMFDKKNITIGVDSRLTEIVTQLTNGFKDINAQQSEGLKNLKAITEYLSQQQNALAGLAEAQQKTTTGVQQTADAHRSNEQAIKAEAEAQRQLSQLQKEYNEAVAKVASAKKQLAEFDTNARFADQYLGIGAKLGEEFHLAAQKGEQYLKQVGIKVSTDFEKTFLDVLNKLPNDKKALESARSLMKNSLWSDISSMSREGESPLETYLRSLRKRLKEEFAKDPVTGKQTPEYRMLNAQIIALEKMRELYAKLREEEERFRAQYKGDPRMSNIPANSGAGSARAWDDWREKQVEVARKEERSRLEREIRYAEQERRETEIRLQKAGATANEKLNVSHSSSLFDTTAAEKVQNELGQYRNAIQKIVTEIQEAVNGMAKGIDISAATAKFRESVQGLLTTLEPFQKMLAAFSTFGGDFSKVTTALTTANTELLNSLKQVNEAQKSSASATSNDADAKQKASEGIQTYFNNAVKLERALVRLEEAERRAGAAQEKIIANGGDTSKVDAYLANIRAVMTLINDLRTSRFDVLGQKGSMISISTEQQEALLNVLKNGVSAEGLEQVARAFRQGKVELKDFLGLLSNAGPLGKAFVRALGADTGFMKYANDLAAAGPKIKNAEQEIADAQARLNSVISRSGNADTTKLQELQVKLQGVKDKLDDLKSRGDTVGAANVLDASYTKLIQSIKAAADAQERLISNSGKLEFLGKNIDMMMGSDFQRRTANLLQRYGSLSQGQATDILQNRSGFDGADGVLARLQALKAKFDEALSNPDLLNQKNYVSSLVMEFGKLATAYRSCWSQAEKLASAQDRANKSNGGMTAEQKQLKEANDWLSTIIRNLAQYQTMIDKAHKLGLDTSDLEKAIAELEKYRALAQSIQAAGGKTASGATAANSRDAGYAQAEANAKVAASSLKLQMEQTKAASSATSQLSEEQQRLAQALSAATREGHGQSQVLSDLKSLMMQYFSVYGAQQFLTDMVNITGELELQERSLEVILGNASAARQMYSEIRDLSQMSPYTFEDLLKAHRQLAAFGIEAKDIFGTLKSLSDIGAGLDVDVSRLILAYGHTRSYGYLSGIQNRQFETAGIDLVGALAQHYNKQAQEAQEEGKSAEFVSRADIFKRMRARSIPFEDVQSVIMDLDKPGGKFYNMQIRQYDTLGGKLRNLRNNYRIMMSEMGQSNHGVLAGGVDMINTLTAHWQRYVNVLKGVAAAYALLKARALLAGRSIVASQKAIAAYSFAQNRGAASTAWLNGTMGSYQAAGAGSKWRHGLGSSAIQPSQGLEAAKAVSQNKELSAVQKQRIAMSSKLSAAQRYYILRQTGVNAVTARSLALASPAARAWKSFQLSLMGAAQSAKAFAASMLTNPMTWITAAIAGIVALSSKIGQMQDNAETVGNNLGDASKTNIEGIKQSLDEYKDLLAVRDGAPVNRFFSGAGTAELRYLDVDEAELTARGVETVFDDLRKKLQSQSPIYDKDFYNIEKMKDQTERVKESFNTLKRLQYVNQVVDASKSDIEGAISNGAPHWYAFWDWGKGEDYLTNAKDYQDTYQTFAQSFSIDDNSWSRLRADQRRKIEQYMNELGTTRKDAAVKYLIDNQDVKAGALLGASTGAMSRLEDRWNSDARQVSAQSKDVQRIAASMSETMMEAYKGNAPAMTEHFNMVMNQVLADAKIGDPEVKQHLADEMAEAVYESMSKVDPRQAEQFINAYYEQMIGAAANNKLQEALSPHASRAQAQKEAGKTIEATLQEYQRRSPRFKEFWAKQGKAGQRAFREEWEKSSRGIIEMVTGAKAWQKVAYDFNVPINFQTDVDYTEFINGVRKNIKEAEEKLKANRKRIKFLLGVDVLPDFKFKDSKSADAFLKSLEKAAQKAWKRASNFYYSHVNDNWQMSEADEKTYNEYKSDYESLKDYVDIVKSLTSGMSYLENQHQSIYDNGKGKGKKTQSNGEDKADREAERRLSARLKLIQDAYSMYKKYFDLYGKDKAIEIVRKNFEDLRPGDFANLTSLDGLIELYEQFVREVKNTKWRRPKDMKDRADSLIASARTSSQTAEYDRDKDAMEKWASQESLWLDRLTKQWDLYDKVRKATGDKALAMRLSGFDGKNFANQAMALRNHIAKEISSFNLKDDNGDVLGFDFSKLFDMSDGQIEDYVKKMLGTSADNTRIKAIVADLKKWRDLEEQVRREGVEGYAELMGSVESYGNTIKKLNDDLQAYKDKLAAARDSGTISQADYEQGVAVKTAQYNLKKFEATAATQLYMGSAVNNMTRARGRQVYDAYIAQLNEAFETGAISAKDYADKVKKVNEQYGKLDTATSDTSAFITGGLDGLFSNREQTGQAQIDKGAKDYEDYKDQYEKFKNAGNEQGMQNAHDGMENAKNMTQTGEAMMKGAGQAAATVAIIDKIVKTINANVQSLKALFDDIAESIDVLGGDAEKFKSSNAYAFVSGFGEASKGATDAWNSLKSGNAMGVLEGGYRSIMAWPMAFARAHDARLQRRIEKLSEDVSKIEGYTETISKSQERALGYDDKSVNASYKSYYDNNEYLALGKNKRTFWGTLAGIGTGLLFADPGLGHIATTYGLGTDLIRKRGYHYEYKNKEGSAGEAMRKYYAELMGPDDVSAYQQQYNLLIQKRKDYIRMYNDEHAKKKKSTQSLEEYKQKIAELDDQIRFFSEDLAKTLWDVDLKGWAEQLGDALMTAFENGEDAAEAFDQNVTSILQGLVKKMLITGMIEPQLEALRKELFGYTDEKGVKHKGTFDAEHPEESQEAAFGTINKYLGNDGSITRALPAYEEFFNSYEARANKEGNTLMNSNSANMSSSIKGMTEQTADLLASYLNAIRADVSVIRQLYGTKAIAYMDSMSVMARSQVQYQSQIAQNTLRNAEAAETIVQTQNNIIYILNAVVNDTKQFNVRAK